MNKWVCSALRANPIVSLVLYFVAVVFFEITGYLRVNLSQLTTHKKITKQFLSKMITDEVKQSFTECQAEARQTPSFPARPRKERQRIFEGV